MENLVEYCCKKVQPCGSTQNGSKEQPQGQGQWLELFLQAKFFDPCGLHQCSKNELKNFCINCNAPVCYHCIRGGSHADHKLLKVCKHVYQTAVVKTEMEKLMDCSNIQPYRCNGKLVITLKPLPRSSSQTNGEASCVACMRKLYDPNGNRYCSIKCKEQATAPKKQVGERRTKRRRKGIYPSELPYSERGIEVDRRKICLEPFAKESSIHIKIFLFENKN